MDAPAQKTLNAAAGGKLVLFAAAMFGFGYAMVPLYYKICEVAGINNLLNPQSAETVVVDENRAVRLEFDTNARGLVSMEPNIRLMKAARPGETYSVIYTLKNLGGRALTAQAVPSYGPPRAGKWFKKIQCFCFGQLTLAAGETRREPVVFVVDAGLPDDIGAIALSYTFFEIDGAEPPPQHGHDG
ncbi:MAG: cytochrome c oxidase assembly protein [Betaproteobacteria bacterium]|nr:cytochrome c oxidase assembly protein [Betaproteobacteria bacterium]